MTTTGNMCGACVSKALTCMNINLYKQKKANLSRRPIFLAILLCEQFIHLLRINSRPSIQFLSINIYFFVVAYIASNGVGPQVLPTLVTALPLSF